MLGLSLRSSVSGTVCCCRIRTLPIRSISISASLAKKQMPPRPTVDESEVTGSYLKGSGPGGQKINKTNSAVQLIHIPTNTVVKSQATRSRSQNQRIATRILAEKIELLEKGDISRASIKAERNRKRKASKAKKSRRKYRTLEEKAKMEGEGEGGEEVEGGDVAEVVEVREDETGTLNESQEDSGRR